MSKQRYPHLLPQERILWDIFMKKFGHLYDRFEYDVHVGELSPEHQLLSGKDREQVNAIYLRRIDVVGYQPGTITILEVGPHAGIYKFGQIIGYMEMYEEYFAPAEDLKGALVTYLVAPDIKKLLERHGVDVYVLERGE